MTQQACQRIEFRCNNKLHAVKKEYPNGKVFLEVRCKDSWCVDRKAGEVVFHYFDPNDGRLDHTKKYKDPGIQQNIGESGKLGQSKHNNLKGEDK